MTLRLHSGETSTVEGEQRDLSSVPNTRLAELTYLIAHELRNPCTIIGGFASLLNRIADPADKTGEYARIIFDESARLEKAIDSVLAFSRHLASGRKAWPVAILARDAVTGLKSRHPSLKIDESCGTGAEKLRALVNAEQFAGALVEVVSRIWLASDERANFSLEIESDMNSGRVNIKTTIAGASDEEVRLLLTGVYAPGREAVPLPMSLAQESLQFNDCTLEIAAAREGQTYLYVDFPKWEGSNA